MEPKDAMVATVHLRQRQWLPAVAVSGSAREREKKCRGRERENGEEGAGPGLKPGKVAARARQVAASAAQANHAALAVCTVMTLFINFKFPILPQTYH